MTHQYAHLPSNPGVHDDEELVKRVLDGQREPGNELFRRHRSSAYRIAYRVMGNDADAQDAVQQGFLKAYAALKGFNGRSLFKTWLMRVVTNTALEVGRRRASRNRVLRNSHASRGAIAKSLAPLDTVMQQELCEVIAKVLRRVPDQQRSVFSMRSDGLTHKQIAALLGVSTAAARLYWKQVRDHLVAELSRLGYCHSIDRPLPFTPRRRSQ